MHRGVQWPQPKLAWPDGKLICCTFRVAYEAFRKSGRFKRTSKIPVNVASPGEVGIALPVATHSQMFPGAVLNVVILAESSVTLLPFCTWVSEYETVHEPV